MAHLPLGIKSPAGLRILAETRLSVAGSVKYILPERNLSVNVFGMKFSYSSFSNISRYSFGEIPYSFRNAR